MRSPTSFHELRAAQAASVLNETQEIKLQNQGGGKDPPGPPKPMEQLEPHRPDNHPSQWKSPWAGYPSDPSLGTQGPAAQKASNEINRQLNARRERSADAANLDKYDEQSQPENELPAVHPPSVNDPALPSEKDMAQDFDNVINNFYGAEREVFNRISQSNDGPSREENNRSNMQEPESPGSRDASEPKFFSERHPSQGHEIEH